MKAQGKWTPIAVLSLAIVLQGCAKNPVTGRSELSLLSESEEIALGAQGRPEVLAQYDSLYREHELQRYVSDVGNRLAKNGHRPGLPYSFEVLNSSEINAFALPGGKLFITRGLLVRLSNEAQLAAVLGHEVGHVTAKHAVRSFSNSLLLQIPLLIGSSYAQAKGKGEYLVLAGAIGASLLQLRFDRRHESQSDRLGIEYAVKAGYHPEGMVQLLEVLHESSPGDPSKLQGWLLTHPLTTSRIAEAQALVAKNYPDVDSMNLAWNPEGFGDALASLRSEQGAFDSFDMAEQSRAGGNYNDALRLYDSAVQQVPDEPIFYTGRGFAKVGLGQFNEARADLHKAVQLAPDLYAAQLGLGVAEMQAGNAGAAASALQASLELLPTSPSAHLFLGQLAESKGEKIAAAEYYRLASQLSENDAETRSGARDGLQRLGQ